MKSYFNELKAHALEIFPVPENNGYDDTVDGARDLVEGIRISLSRSGQRLGMWEENELNDACRALEAGFPKLALIAAGKAMAVCHLSKSEYDFGFDFARRQEDIIAEKNRGSMNIAALHKAVACELCADHERAAELLAQNQDEVAKRLEAFEEKMEAELILVQQNAAAALARENQAAADDLQKAQQSLLETLKAVEEKRLAQHMEREQVLSWMAGGYSVECPMQDIAFENEHALLSEVQKAAALELKKRQDKAADDLEECQARAAVARRKARKHEAAALRDNQQHAAVKLRESHTIKALLKIQEDDVRAQDAAA